MNRAPAEGLPLQLIDRRLRPTWWWIRKDLVCGIPALWKACWLSCDGRRKMLNSFCWCRTCWRLWQHTSILDLVSYCWVHAMCLEHPQIIVFDQFSAWSTNTFEQACIQILKELGLPRKSWRCHHSSLRILALASNKVPIKPQFP